MKPKSFLLPSLGLITVIAALVAVGCSSLPKKVESRTVSRAGVIMRLARDAQRQRKYEKARKLYRDAYDLYTRVDHIGGKIDAGLAIARQYFYQEDQEQMQVWLDRASDLIGSGSPERQAVRAVLLMEMAFARDDYPKIVEIALKTPLPQNDPEGQAEMLSYVMVAKAKLKQPHGVELDHLLKLLPDLQKRFGKNRLQDPEVLSLAYYNTGYIYSSLQRDWRTALEYFARARDVDGLIDNAYGVAKDVYAMGRCYRELGDFKDAVSCYKRAGEIFRLLDQPEMAEKAGMQADSARRK